MPCAAVVVGLEQPADAAETGRLEVENAGWPWQCLDVANRVDRLVPRDPVSVAVEQLDGVVGHRGILDPCPRQPLEYATEEVRVRVHGHGCIAVVTLHVDHIDAAERCQLCEKVVIPGCGGIELEMQTGIHSAQCLQGGEAGGLTEPDRHYESDGLRHSPDGILQREPVWRKARSSAALSNAQRR